jgi:hypothetical protein
MSVIALAGQAATQPPQLVHRFASTRGNGGPPMRGVKPIACSGQASAQDWQCTPCLVRHAGPIIARAGFGDPAPVRKKRRVARIPSGLSLWRTGRSVGLLVHPDRESPAAHHTDRSHRPHNDCQHEEDQQLQATAAPVIFDAHRLTKVRLHHRSRLASLRCPMRYVMYK